MREHLLVPSKGPSPQGRAAPELSLSREKGLPWMPAEPPWAPPNSTFPRALSVPVAMGCHQDGKARGLERFVREQRSLPLSQLR